MTILNYHDADKVGIISTTKIASTSIRDFYGYDEYSSIHLPCFNLDYIDGKWNVKIQDFNLDNGIDNIPKQIIDANDSFNKLVNGELSKDIIIVIRNPIKRFLSAFNEDFVTPILNINRFKLFGSLLLNTPSINMDKARLYELRNHINDMGVSYIGVSHNQTQSDLTDSLDKDVLDLIASIMLTEYSTKKFPIWSVHNTPYHSTLLPFINDLNANITIVDIDESDLSNYLNLYEDNPKKLNRLNISSVMGKSLTYAFNERINNDFILHELQNEILSYNILKSKIKN